MKGLSILAASGTVLLASETVSPLTVLGLGISIVFIGLICIIILINIMGRIVRAFIKNDKKQSEPAPAAVSQPAAIPNRREFVAAVTAAIAEDLGQDVSKIRIHSIRRI